MAASAHRGVAWIYRFIPGLINMSADEAAQGQSPVKLTGGSIRLYAAARRCYSPPEANRKMSATVTTDPDKNLHASVSPALLARAQEVAEQEHITLDELVSDAMERRVNKREFDEVLAFGKRHAKARGLKPSAVASAIAAARSEPKERGR